MTAFLASTSTSPGREPEPNLMREEGTERDGSAPWVLPLLGSVHYPCTPVDLLLRVEGCDPLGQGLVLSVFSSTVGSEAIANQFSQGSTARFFNRFSSKSFLSIHGRSVLDSTVLVPLIENDVLVAYELHEPSHMSRFHVTPATR